MQLKIDLALYHQDIKIASGSLDLYRHIQPKSIEITSVDKLLFDNLFQQYDPSIIKFRNLKVTIESN